MTSRRGAARAPLAVLALTAALVLAACGGESTDAASSGPSASPSDSGPSDEGASPTTDASTSPSTSASPSDTAGSVPPATGPAMELTGLTLHVPTGWELSTNAAGKQQGAYNASGGPGAMSVSILSAVPGESFETTLDGSLRSQTSDGLEPERLDDVTLDGVPAWVITGSKRGIALQYEVGGVVDNKTWEISFQYLTEPPPDVQSLIDSVLASVVFDAA